MDNKLLDSTNDVEFNLATFDIKGRRFAEAAVKFEALVRTKNSPQAWCGLALSKLGLLLDAEVTVDEVFFCFETAKKLDSSGAGEIESLVADTTFGAMTEMYAVKAFSRQVKDEAHKEIITGLFTTVAGGVLGGRKEASLYSTITGVGASAFGAKMINDGAETKAAARLTEAKVQSILGELEDSSKKFLSGNQQLLEDFSNRVESLHQAIRQLEANEEAAKREKVDIFARVVSDIKAGCEKIETGFNKIENHITKQNESEKESIKPSETLQAHSNKEVEEIVARHGSGIIDSKIWFAPNIPTAKLQGAIKSYAQSVTPSDVLMLMDTTLRGGCGDGMLITRDRLCAHNFMQGSKVLGISDIKKVHIGGLFPKALVINDDKFLIFQYPDNKANQEKICRLVKDIAPRAVGNQVGQ